MAKTIWSLLVIWAQVAGYPITLIPTGKSSGNFPPGYQIPWDKIEIRVTEKMSPNLFVLHGSPDLDPAHPDASIKVLVNSHIHSDHTGANAFFAKQGALVFAQENLRNEMMRPPGRGGNR